MRSAAVLLALALAAPAGAGEILAARNLAPGTVLAPADLRVAEPGPGSEARIAELVGQEIRRAVYAGRPVAEGAPGPATLVERNAVVVMDYAAGALSIRTEGRALDAGAAGERIRVMNLASRITVTAVVSGPDRVSVTP
jgi:flagella basal body P-ring formation protein FlgA